MVLNGEERATLEILDLERMDVYAQDIVEQSRGAVPQESIYMVLSRLESEGLVESMLPQTSTDSPRYRVYRITDGGRLLLHPDRDPLRTTESSG